MAVASLLRNGAAAAVGVRDWDYPATLAGSTAISVLREEAVRVAALFDQYRDGIPLEEFHRELGTALGYDGHKVECFARKNGHVRIPVLAPR